MQNRKLTREELSAIAQLGDARLTALAKWANKQLTCSHCGKCTRRCEVLERAALDVGMVEERYDALMALPPEERPAATIRLVTERPEIFIALRQCCFCGHCTAACAHHVLAADRMRDWRKLFMEAGYMPPDDSRIVMVDNEWHIFSAYRAIYGIGYPEYTYLAQAAEAARAGADGGCPAGTFDTVFLPGCSLVSYAPELTRKAGEWLTEAGVRWVISDDCCGSPLMSAGLFDRAKALRQRVVDQMAAAGIKRMLTVCPGCGEEFAEECAEAGIEIMPLPELLLEKAREKERAGAVAGGLECGFAGGKACEGVPSKREVLNAGGSKDAAEIVAARARLCGFSPLEGVGSVTVFDSCHDRADGTHGATIRALLQRYVPEAQLREMDYRKRGTLCCGAGGAVGSYDPAITDRRVWRLIDEARKTEAQTLVTMCPTCAYTVAQACLNADSERGIENRHYLEMLFGERIDWERIFGELNDMWSGEYGPWLMQTFYG